MQNKFFGLKNKLALTILFFMFSFLCLSQNVFAQALEEKITSFNTEIQVLESGDILVTEKIRYDFGNNEKRGIFREIPLSKVPGAIKKIDIELLSVTDELGKPYEYLTEDNYVNWFDFRIGNPDVYLTGEHTYVINYRVKNAVGSFKDFSEVYWNSTGDSWEVPIENASSRIVLTMIIDESDLQTASYCGESGSDAECSGAMQISYGDDTTVIDFSADQPQSLDEHEGMTVAVGFPKGLIAEPDWLLALLVHTWKYIFYFFPFVIVYFWFRKRIKFWIEKRRFYNNNPIVVQYDGGDLDPMQISGILNGYIKNEAIVAQIIFLAVRGYLVIKNTEGRYEFISTDKKKDELSDYDLELLNKISNKKENELVGDFYQTIDKASSMVAKLLKSNYLLQMFSSRSDTSLVVSVFLPFFLAINPGVFILFFLGTEPAVAFSGACVVIGLINLILKPKQYPDLTNLGLEKERYIKGLEWYIKSAEQARINFHNAPEKNPETFEKLLPFAIVLGLEKEWATQFDEIQMNNLSWYGDGSTNFSAVSLASQMKTFSVRANSVIFAYPVSASSHSSSGGFGGSSSRSSSSGGSSGGGSSGGGGGGGGGRSW